MCDASNYAIGAVLDQRKLKMFYSICYASKTLDDAQMNYTTIDKDLLAVVWKFDIKIRDRKGTKNQVADHLSRLENHEHMEEGGQIKETLPDEHIFAITHDTALWYVDYVNYLVSRVLPLEIQSEARKTFTTGMSHSCTATLDYVSKWVEAVAFPTNDAKVVATFVKDIFSRFRTPRALISDEGTHFCNRLLNNLLAKYGVHYRVATTYHPQIRGQAEVSNRLKLFPGKLKSRWSGPFEVVNVNPYGTIVLRTLNGKRQFLVNGQRVKNYWGGVIDRQKSKVLLVDE
ncbi:uncharacterized protein LOC142177084 [Nicotiana tabacum]|uniref:Uncharacterized protein LOC142177084 n=1 Tax=Nicotiana tabacum TaxID=4097 RepID=A0AC58TWR3_TOBAC